MESFVKDAFRIGLLDVEEQRQKVTQFLGMIQRFAEVLSEETDVKPVCRLFAQIIIEETNFENCSILLWDSGRSKLHLEGAYGLEDQLEDVYRHQYRQSLSFCSGEGISGQVFSTGNGVYIEDAAKESIPDLKDAVVRPCSLASVPLLDLGVLNVSAYHVHRFGADAKRNWEILGNIIGYLLLGLKHSARPGRTARPEPPILQLVHLSGDNSPAGPVGIPPIASPDRTTPARPLSDIALDSAPQGICIMDENGTILHLNRTFEKLQGGEASVLVGRSPAVLFQDPQVFEKLFRRVAQSGQVEKSDVNLMNSTGEAYIADIHLVRIEEEEGKPSGYLLFIEDITKKKAFSEKIIQSEKLAALGTMAGGVSHDFNNLLMAILGHVQLILPQIKEEDVKRRLQNIEKAIYDGSNTVRRLQRFTEREREPQRAAYAVDVGEALKDVIELTRPRWKNFMERSGHRIELEMDLEPGCMASIHVSDLREVLTNLVLNAIDAMPEGGTLTLKTSSVGEHALIDVADTGIGMSREVSEKIFDPFYTTKGIGNSGLGLSVSWSLIGRYGGDIQVKSKSGKGTTFTLRLSRAEAARMQAAPSKGDDATSSYRVLLVEDDLEILNILRDMLRLKGHRVLATADGERAISLLQKEKFDLVLTDLGMPVVSGWEIAKAAKSRDAATPVIMVTGWGAQYEEEDLASRGVDLMLAKPLSWEKLLGSIEKML